MKKNILFITAFNFDEKELIGIKKKVLSQRNALTKIFNKVDFITVRSGFNLHFNEIPIKSFKCRILLSMLFFLYVIKVTKNNKYDVIYIRNPFVFDQIGYWFFLYLNRHSKIILEVPTYPYDTEKHGFFQKTILYSEKIVRFFYRKYINLILYSGNKVDFIWGIKAVQVKNGIDFDSIPLNNSENINNKIRFISVASYAKWHGLERLINGISLFHKNSQNSNISINLNVVGDSKEYIYEYKKLVNENNLKDIVHFYGTLTGDDLDNVFNDSDIGIGSLGMHRIGLNEGSPLKSAEYAARGIPFIVGYKDSNFFKYDFCFEVSNDETPIDILKIIDWYKSLDYKKNNLRNIAITETSWINQLNSILKEE